ncbi:hypothetical protein D9757_010287 [Collybiopsis confluens]|uniref:Ubiquitin-like protease family profile domain-containing protein n=1 Tax=Collybiopsis confluens TaxID=2823264 RepID=A0A8H5GUD6_9AGAR|nr:hypothetical protein D9757_010287 [Collybiopsis confluens]
MTTSIIRRVRLNPPEPHLRELVECTPFSAACSCNSQYVMQLASLVETMKMYLHNLNISDLFVAGTLSNYQQLVGRYFQFSLSVQSNDSRLYAEFDAHIKRLQQGLRRLLRQSQDLESKFVPCTRRHRPLQSDSQALVVFGNLRLLLDSVQGKIISMESEWHLFLDYYPQKAEDMLRALMTEASDYFLSAFSCFYQDYQCLEAKTGTLTPDDANRVVKACRKVARDLGLSNWDSVFIPINEDLNHWYSAHIDFRFKRIDIYDSLEERCLSNRQKPVPQRKNTQLMLVLMWLTEVLGRLRGDQVKFSPGGCSSTGWAFDPHSVVYFQPNSYDCGIHTLWHLQHVLEYRQIQMDKTSVSDSLRFTSDMVGKRMRLAQEILRDCE